MILEISHRFFKMLAVGQQQSNIRELVSLFQRKIILDYDKYVCFLLGGFPIFCFFFSVFGNGNQGLLMRQSWN